MKALSAMTPQEIAEASAKAMWNGDSASQRLGMSLDHVAPGEATLSMTMAEAMSAAVEQFGTASAQLAGNLQRIEAALDKSLNRSDEQMAYYVAQAREIIDLSMMSQQRIVDDLQQIKIRPAALADEV